MENAAVVTCIPTVQVLVPLALLVDVKLTAPVAVALTEQILGATETLQMMGVEILHAILGGVAGIHSDGAADLCLEIVDEENAEVACSKAKEGTREKEGSSMTEAKHPRDDPEMAKERAKEEVDDENDPREGRVAKGMDCSETSPRATCLGRAAREREEKDEARCL